MRLQAEGVFTFGGGTRHLGALCHHAFVGHGLDIADQGPVAKVTVFQGGAVGISLAFARESGTTATALLAVVGYGAGVLIVACPNICRVLAAACVGADVVGTRIAIVALHRVPEAGACDAVICHGAGVAILAGSTLQQFVGAALLGQAFVLCAIIVVVAKVNVGALHEVRLVNLTVAVVVETVASLNGRGERVTLKKPVFRADSLALAESKSVFNFAGCPEGEGHRIPGARTLPRVGHAL